MGIIYILRDVQQAIQSTKAIYNQTKLIKQIILGLIIWNTTLTLWLITATGVMIVQEYHKQHNDFIEVPIEALEVM